MQDYTASVLYLTLHFSVWNYVIEINKDGLETHAGRITKAFSHNCSLWKTGCIEKNIL